MHGDAQCVAPAPGAGVQPALGVRAQARAKPSRARLAGVACGFSLGHPLAHSQRKNEKWERPKIRETVWKTRSGFWNAHSVDEILGRVSPEVHS